MIRSKEFRTCWPSYFVDISVKGTNNFWKFHGLIDGFNNFFRQIASGVEKMPDEFMSAILFLTTPKGDLLYYYYMFRKLRPLETEKKDVECSR